MLSKSEKKRLAKAALENQKNKVHSSFIYCAKDLALATIKEWISQKLSEHKVFLEMEDLSESSITIYIPGNSDLSCSVSLSEFQQDIISPFASYEYYDDFMHAENSEFGSFLEISGARESQIEINFIFNTLLRCLGANTKGVLFDCEQQYVNLDWVAWSCDYLDKNLFLAYNCPELKAKYPKLVVKKKLFGIF